MKRILSLITVLGTFLSACTDTELNRIVIEKPQGDAMATLDLRSDAENFRIDEAGNPCVTLLSSGGSVAVQALTAQTCGCTTDAEWIEALYDNDTQRLQLSAGANPQRADRVGVVILTAGEGATAARCSILVTQNGTGTPELSLGQPVFTFPVSEQYGPMSHTFEVHTNQDEWSFENRTNDWLHIEKGEGTLTMTARPNTGLTLRQTEVTVFAGTGEKAVRRVLTVSQDAAAYISVASNFSLSYNALSTRLPIRSNYPWRAESDAGWIAATDGGEGYLLLSTETNRSSTQSRTATLTLTAGPTENNRAEVQLLITQYGYNGRALVFEVVNFAAGNTIYLPIGGEVDCTVDWGDGTVEQVASAAPSHQFETVGFHPVSVTGTVTALSINAVPTGSRNYITGVAQWGNTGLQSLNRAFYECVNLRFLAADTEHSLSEVTTFEEAFYGCERLQTLPEDLFVSARKATSFYGTFQGCTLLPSIPEGLFDNAAAAETFRFTFNGCTAIREIPESLFARCPLATSFYGTFYGCQALRSVPAGLFASNPQANSFGYTFNLCTALEEVPEGLFAACPEVMTFASVFRGCAALKHLPARIFDHNRKVRIWSGALSNCPSLTGESPYTLVEGNKVHLYERENHPAEFTAPTTTATCFANSTGLSDYDRIPATWL